MSNFESGTIKIGDLFSDDRFYRIPNYQRPFSWDADNFSDLINDTIKADRQGDYFLGTVVFYLHDGNRIVVDGQQRITSLLILLACVRDAVEDQAYKKELQGCIIQKEQLLKKIPSRERLEVKDRAIFNQVVLEEGGTLSKINPKDLTEPANRYVIAAQIFHEKLGKMSEAEKIDYVNYLTQKCVLIFLQAKTFEEAFRLFEIVNDRGKQLRRIDVLKSLNLSPDYVTSDAARDILARKWEEDEESVGEDTFESVFFLIRLILIKDKPQGDLLSEFKDRIFDKGIVRPGEQFLGLVSEYSSLYRKIFLDRNYLEGESSDNKFQSLMFVMDQEFKASEWRACVLAFSKKFGRDSFYEFCLGIEKLFLTHWVDAVRKDERYTDYTKILNLIDASKNPAAVIENIGGDIDKIKNDIINSDLYGKGYAKYALLRLELSVSEFEQPKLLTARSIEHVFPQNPEAEGAWDKLATADQRKAFVHKAGNLVLLSKGRNSSASNREFAEKKATYLKDRVSDYPRSIQVLGYEAWSPEVIDDRTKAAAESIVADL